MKIKRLIIKNIGKISEGTIDFNKPLILFYGEILQGKTTILNAVKWCFGGNYPLDIIQHGKVDGKVTLEFEGGSITREWYIGKDKITNTRPIIFIQDGKPVKRPVDEIKKFLNPYLLDQDYLRKMTELERKAYFVQLLGIDTTEIDQQYAKIESEAKDLRAKIRGYGTIDTTEVKSIDIFPIRTELANIRTNHSRVISEINIQNRKVIEYNHDIAQAEADIKSLEYEIDRITNQLNDLLRRQAELEEKQNNLFVWIKENPKKVEIEIPEPPDTSILETKIGEAIANEVKVEQYRKNLERAIEKEKDESKLSELEDTQRKLKRGKVARLTKISETCGIKNLSFDEEGNFIYEGTTAGMLSGSQIMKLSEELSSLYPKDLGISLIDRAESLGKSVFPLVDRAKEEEKTILATVVGEKPANVPEEIGVFIVEDGNIKNKEN